jgi:hypothetical protein
MCIIPLIFIPDFTVVGGFQDRDPLYFIVYRAYVGVKTLLQQEYFLVGLLDAQWGRSAPKSHIFVRRNRLNTENPTTAHNTQQQGDTMLRRATSATASAATHDPLASDLAPCTCSPHHGQCRTRSVFFNLRWGVSCVTFFIIAIYSKILPIGGNIGRSLCHWQSAAHSGAMHLLTTLWATPGTLVWFYFALGVAWGAKKATHREIDRGAGPRPYVAANQ